MGLFGQDRWGIIFEEGAGQMNVNIVNQVKRGDRLF